jgi:hypothetical protein
MRKSFVLPILAVGAVAFPAAAGAGIFHGVVIAKQSGRHALVIASQTGAVHTIRSKQRRIGVGARLDARVGAARQGVYRATKLVRRGQASRARVRGVVARNMHSKLLVSAGHSVFTIKTARSLSASLRRGDIIDAHLKISKSGGVEADDLDEVGQADTIELEGTLVSVTAPTATQPGSLTVKVGGLSFDVVVPIGFDVSGLTPGDRVEVKAIVDGTTLTLVKVESEDDQGDDDQGDDDQGDDDGGDDDGGDDDGGGDD